MPWGAYFYSYACSEASAKSELEHALRLLKGKKPTLPVAFDMEDADGYKAKHVPCDFLRDDGECMLGECRPVSCKLYPYTDQEGRLEGLLSMIDNTEICPVVYHIYEDLKKIYGFR